MAQRLTPTRPDISVVMSVYNGETYLREAVDSILAQSYKNFEFVIIDDGSTDTTLKILQSYQDPRIVIISRSNKGLVASLNEGIKKARGTYIARQDADDRSASQRLAKQIKVAKATGAGVVGTAFAMLSTAGDVVGQQAVHEDEAALKLALRTGNPFGHGSIMMLRSAVQAVGGYSDKVGPAEDYDLWLRLAPTTAFAGLNQVLYFWRVNPTGISHQNSAGQVASADRLRAAYNQRYPLTKKEVQTSVRSYRRLRKRRRSLDRLLARQLASERLALSRVAQDRGQRLRITLGTILLQPDASRLRAKRLGTRVKNKVAYLRTRGGSRGSR